jgi:hypothetical protein
MISLSLTALAYAQTGNIYFKEDFNYSSLDQMQATDWAFTRPAGISVAAGAVTLDGADGDCSMHRAVSFSSNVYDWKAEVRSMWLGQRHSVLSVFVGTERHSYGFAVDGYYKEFSFYRDSQKVLHFGIYGEQANAYVVLSMVREGNTFSFYFNGELKNTYTEQDTLPSKITSVDLVSPWRGDAKYDYYQIGEPNAVFESSTFTPAPSGATDSFPMIPVLIGGGITAVIIGGIVVYYFFVAGGSSASAGASAGGSVGSAGAGSSGSGGEGGGSIIQEHPISPLSGEAPLSPTAVQGATAGGQAGTTDPNPLKPIGTVICGQFDLSHEVAPPNSLHPDSYGYKPEDNSAAPEGATAGGQAGTTNSQNTPNPQSSPSQNPVEAPAGTQVTIGGTGFGPARSVNMKTAQNNTDNVEQDNTSDDSK